MHRRSEDIAVDRYELGVYMAELSVLAIVLQLQLLQAEEAQP